MSHSHYMLWVKRHVWLFQEKPFANKSFKFNYKRQGCGKSLLFYWFSGGGGDDDAQRERQRGFYRICKTILRAGGSSSQTLIPIETKTMAN